MTANNLPLRLYYRLDEAAQLLGCTESDLIHWGAVGTAQLLVNFIDPVAAYVVLDDENPILDYDSGNKWFSAEVIGTGPLLAVSEKVPGCEVNPNGFCIHGWWIVSPRELAMIELNHKRGADGSFVVWRDAGFVRHHNGYLAGAAIGDMVEAYIDLEEHAAASQLFIAAHHLRGLTSAQNVSAPQTSVPDRLPAASAYASFESHAGQAPYLAQLISACHQFWSTYDPEDPTTAPTNAEVQDWLSAQGVAERVAEVMAQILRPEGLPSGPRRHKRRG